MKPVIRGKTLLPRSTPDGSEPHKQFLRQLEIVSLHRNNRRAESRSVTTTTGAELPILSEEGNGPDEDAAGRTSARPETLVRQGLSNPELTKVFAETDDHGGGKKCEAIWTTTGGVARRAGGRAQECQLGLGQAVVHGRVGEGECLAVLSVQKR